MEIRKTKVIGFCGGVRRAIKMAEDNPGAYIAAGEIVHNPHETARLLRDFDVGPLEIDAIPNGGTALIRAHGIGEAEQKSMEARGIKIIDATCPNVKRVQDLAREFSESGRAVFLFGETNHPEVLGIIGRAANVFAFSSVDQLRGIALPERVALISQTTKPINEFQEAEKFLSEKIKDFQSVCTICPATQNNQKAAAELAKWADIMIVIGGKNSSNTKALAAAAGPFCQDIFQVENAAELRPEWFDGKQHCAIAAGLSTPDYSIEEVESAIARFLPPFMGAG
ncbi:MAG: 4-hydroxy-3-methylbut-2-enyl diphosphate reductase [Rickettsiales bacterium]|jgi:4-hydroxy-3-methylbut-2-enyl diphosphate reductase|nr:4-hydroxy-3-methylbut-2-enyl diphosphate reductase [Rickettsiales bacterium]